MVKTLDLRPAAQEIVEVLAKNKIPLCSVPDVFALAQDEMAKQTVQSETLNCKNCKKIEKMESRTAELEEELSRGCVLNIDAKAVNLTCLELFQPQPREDGDSRGDPEGA